MNKRRGGPVSFKRTLKTIRPKLVSNVYNRLEGNGSSGGEGRGVRGS